MKKCTNRRNIAALIISYNCDYNIVNSVKNIIDEVDKVYIVDNGSSSESLSILSELDNIKKINIIYNNENLGIAKALNIGIKEAKSENIEWILTLDQDSLCEKNMIDNIFKYYQSLSYEEQKKVGILAPIHRKIIDIKNIKNEAVDKKMLAGKEILAEITSGNIVKMEVFEVCGYFEEKLFIDYVDFEYCLRIKQFGYKIILVENAILFHILGEPKELCIGKKKYIYSTHSEVRHYYMWRNRIYVWKKYIKHNYSWVIKDFILCIRDFLKIIILEDNSIRKIKFSIYGIKDDLCNKYGKYEKKKGKKGEK
ncbi:glycosyltransferase family 2 protein [Clostridium perfringens]|uniref:glycosyltransferase family 2 protein n=1 Tax=Clostridium perfringens TaxID=1502 RepID=UPI0032DAFF17